MAAFVICQKCAVIFKRKYEIIHGTMQSYTYRITDNNLMD